MFNFISAYIEKKRIKIYNKLFNIQFSSINWRYNQQLQILKSFYKLFEFGKPRSKRLVLVMTDDTERHGLADRIRTIISGYVIACKNDMEFYLHHSAGFAWETYLEPNQVNWLIKQEDISRGLNRVNILWFPDKWPHIDNQKKEYHGYRLYPLWDYLEKEEKHNYSFYDIFWKLFKPSAHLSNIVESTLSQCQLKEKEYIAFHLRFLNFFELVERNSKKVTSTPEQRKLMVERVHKTIEEVYKKSGCKKVLLFSDSNSFLNMEHPSYICTIPGNVAHIGKKAHDNSITDKVFIDLFVMSKAKIIYSIVGENIYGGRFSQAASKIGNVPFKRVHME